MLSEKELYDIKQLQDTCEKADHIQLKLNWEMLKERGSNILDFFHYEGDALAGYLAIYPFGKKYEISGMVHTDFRRKGIFSELFRKAIVNMPENAKEILINAPANSDSAKQWLQKYPAVYDFSEYQMQWHDTSLESKNFAHVKIREANSADLETKIRLDVKCFGFDEAGAREFNQENVKNHKKSSYMIEVNEEIIGKIGIMRDEEETYIYGFAIFPESQGKGYGRTALTKTVLAESDAGKTIVLEVAAENKNALKLYENCGFKSYEVQDYYSYPVKGE
ncbi:GNAT family N-acetyltransferase [Virgibacillus flavescens]|uniref:GNAT family N-acetyltransferase n=1 Tax=Virgibacillus flavescens TaxID=1611422 RepID=UPI003D35879F